MLRRKSVLRNFAKFTRKHLCQGLFFNKVAATALLKKRLWHRCFPLNFAKFLRTPFLQNTSRQVLLLSRLLKNFSFLLFLINFSSIVLLTHFSLMFHFHNLWKRQKTKLLSMYIPCKGESGTGLFK